MYTWYNYLISYRPNHIPEGAGNTLMLKLEIFVDEQFYSFDI